LDKIFENFSLFSFYHAGSIVHSMKFESAPYFNPFFQYYWLFRILLVDIFTYFFLHIIYYITRKISGFYLFI